MEGIMYEFVLLKDGEKIPIKSNREQTFILARGDGFYILKESDDGGGYKFYKISKRKRKKIILLPVSKKETNFLTETYVKKSLVLKQRANRRRLIYQISGDKINKFLRFIRPVTSIILKRVDRESIVYNFGEYKLPSV